MILAGIIFARLLSRLFWQFLLRTGEADSLLWIIFLLVWGVFFTMPYIHVYVYRHPNKARSKFLFLTNQESQSTFPRDHYFYIGC